MLMGTYVKAQTPKSFSSADVLQSLEKLKVFGSVLYIAAHPDDENTRLLAYLANERKFKTGYLSLTRGDGGQNLIGDEQGIALGLIRTQELLAARRVDGAEQFFTRAYDFGYSKSPEEALKIWGHDKILSDVVWVIRKFRPDVIITRFPTTGEGGHGHHTASAMLAVEAFDAAADPNKFSEQLQYGVQTWQTKRLFWNTFNFGGNNTTRPHQLKMDVGLYNPVLGKSYGEIAAESRSQHKSQGFGVPAQRGESFEFFSLLKGDSVQADIMDGIDVSSARLQLNTQAKAKYDGVVDDLIASYNAAKPQPTVKKLVELYQWLGDEGKTANKNLLNALQQKIAALLPHTGGLFMEATVANQLNVIGDSVRYTVQLNNRLGIPVENAQVSILGNTLVFDKTSTNENSTKTGSYLLPAQTPSTQPYWLEYNMEPGAFTVNKQEDIGLPEKPTAEALFQLKLYGTVFNFKKPIYYKFTDPVKGELYEQPQWVNPAFVNVSPSLIIFSNKEKGQKKRIDFTVQTNKSLEERLQFRVRYNGHSQLIFDSIAHIQKMEKKQYSMLLNGDSFAANSSNTLQGQLEATTLTEAQLFSLAKIGYNHIPDIYYGYLQTAKVLKMDLQVSGSKIGYINGAGDKVPQALEQMGYQVTMLLEQDINRENLKQFDAVVAGIRAYNTNAWLSGFNEVLNEYVRNGGVLLVQYNTNNFAGPLKQKIGPYPFTISRNRITDETASVNFVNKKDPLLHYPNIITPKDFEGWIQERSIYHAEQYEKNYRSLFSMNDPGEAPHAGSTIVADYGKGRFIYTGLAFFRELPAGIPGAFRLMANFLAKPR